MYTPYILTNKLSHRETEIAILLWELCIFLYILKKKSLESSFHIEIVINLEIFIMRTQF